MSCLVPMVPNVTHVMLGTYGCTCDTCHAWYLEHLMALTCGCWSAHSPQSLQTYNMSHHIHFNASYTPHTTCPSIVTSRFLQPHTHTPHGLGLGHLAPCSLLGEPWCGLVWCKKSCLDCIVPIALLPRPLGQQLMMMTVMSALVILIRFALVVCVCMYECGAHVYQCGFLFICKHCNFMFMATVTKILVFPLGCGFGNHVCQIQVT
jgi:hypothetical protein